MSDQLGWYFVKAMKSNSQNVTGYSKNWFGARMRIMKVFSDRVICGSWNLPLEELSNLTMYRQKKEGWSTTIMKFSHKGITYQFGFNPWINHHKILPLKFKEELFGQAYSLYLTVVRIGAFAVLFYLLFRMFQ